MNYPFDPVLIFFACGLVAVGTVSFWAMRWLLDWLWPP
jgi:hypothetical protein